MDASEALGRKWAWLKAVANVVAPGPSRMATLVSLTFLTDAGGVGAPPIGAIVEKRIPLISSNTVCRHLVWFIDRDVLKKEALSRKGVPRHITYSKKYILVGLTSMRAMDIEKWKKLQRESWCIEPPYDRQPLDEVPV